MSEINQVTIILSEKTPNCAMIMYEDNDGMKKYGEDYKINSEKSISNEKLAEKELSNRKSLVCCTICSKKIKYLASHKIHGLSKAQIKQVSYENRKRKQKITKSARKCPMEKCANKLPLVRLDKHLQKFHKMDKNHQMYRRFINTYAPRIKLNSTSGEPVTLKETEKTKLVKFQEPTYYEIAAEAFFMHLQSLNGGLMSKYNAKQYKCKLAQILKGSKIKSDEEFESLYVLEKVGDWIQKYIKHHKESSACFYASIVIKFIKYLGTINHEKETIYNVIIRVIQNWTRAYKPAKVSARKAINDIAVDEIQAFRLSEIFKTCEMKLKLLENGTMDQIKETEHSQIRNFLILLAILWNSCRSCVLVNMTVKELKEAEKQEEKGKFFYVIFIENHKTRREHGPARIRLEEEHYKYFLCYLEKIRSRIIPVDSQLTTVFITWSGEALKSDNLNKGIQRLWKEAGLQSKISTTIIRKIVTTRIHANEDNQTKDEIAQHFCHRTSTAEKSYKTYMEASQSVTASELVHDTLAGININNNFAENEKCSDVSRGQDQESTFLLQKNDGFEENEEFQNVYKDQESAFLPENNYDGEDDDDDDNDDDYSPGPNEHSLKNNFPAKRSKGRAFSPR